MTTLRDQMAADLQIFFNPDEFADEVAYTSRISGGKTILAIVEFNENFEEREHSVREFGRMTIKMSDIPAPACRDTFVLGGQTYTIRRILSGDEHTWTLEFERDVRPTFGGKRHD